MSPGRAARASAALAVLLLLALAGCASAPPRSEGVPAAPGAHPPGSGAPPAEPGPAPPPPAGGEGLLLWEIRDREAGSGGVVYLLGSVHLGDDATLQLDPAIRRAFARADVLVVEVDTGALSPEEMAEKTLDRALLPEGETLASRLSPDTYRLLAGVLAERYSVDVASMERYEPWFVGIGLLSLEMQRRGYDAERGVDRHLLEEAAGGKEIVALETYESQLDLLDGLEEPLQELVLEDALLRIREMGDRTEDLIAAWRRGDAERLEDAVFSPMYEHPELRPFYEKTFFDRNRAMAREIRSLLEREKTWFVVVGAGHVVGDRGIVQLLARAGCEARRVPASR